MSADCRNVKRCLPVVAAQIHIVRANCVLKIRKIPAHRLGVRQNQCGGNTNRDGVFSVVKRIGERCFSVVVFYRKRDFFFDTQLNGGFVFVDDKIMHD